MQVPSSPPDNPDGGDHSKSRTAASRGSSFDAPPSTASASTGASSKANVVRPNLSLSEQRNKEPDDAGRQKDLAARSYSLTYYSLS
jgi:hypothetical protein